jgi:hypothetical protein
MRATDLASLIEAVQAAMPADWHIAKGHGDRWEFALDDRVYFRVVRTANGWTIIGPDDAMQSGCHEDAAADAKRILAQRLSVLSDEADILRAALYPHPQDTP